MTNSCIIPHSSILEGIVCEVLGVAGIPDVPGDPLITYECTRNKYGEECAMAFSEKWCVAAYLDEVLVTRTTSLYLAPYARPHDPTMRRFKLCDPDCFDDAGSFLFLVFR